jgi:hypothetical protein
MHTATVLLKTDEKLRWHVMHSIEQQPDLNFSEIGPQFSAYEDTPQCDTDGLLPMPQPAVDRPLT